jgi:hypothetical protein
MVVRCFTEGAAFDEPFFDQTIDRCLRDPFRLLFWRETGIHALAELASELPGLEPAGFIFHMSRCGSTLVAQMLRSLPEVLAVSEAGPIDAMLRSNQIDWLRWMVSALGQPRRTAHSQLVVKLDAWAIFALPLVRQAFPDVPCVFVYRDPIEVVVSHLGHRGYHTVPGTLRAEGMGLPGGISESPAPEQYVAAVLGAICSAAVAAARTGGLTLVNYDSLPGAVESTVAPLFGIDVGPAARVAFARAASKDAKNSYLPFVPDAAEKHGAASARTREAVDIWLRPAYDALERMRCSRP